MQVADHIQSPLRVDEDDVIRVGQTSVPIDPLIEAFKAGQTPDAIASDYPELTRLQIYATITYYLEHEAEIERYLVAREADADAAWDRSFAASEDWLARMEAQVLKDYHEGRTDELHPDAL